MGVMRGASLDANDGCASLDANDGGASLDGVDGIASLDRVDGIASLDGVNGVTLRLMGEMRAPRSIDNYRSVATFIIIWAVINIKDKGGIQKMPPFCVFWLMCR